jgi:hypothetical protein
MTTVQATASIKVFLEDLGRLQNYHSKNCARFYFTDEKHLSWAPAAQPAHTQGPQLSPSAPESTGRHAGSLSLSAHSPIFAHKACALRTM